MRGERIIWEVNCFDYIANNGANDKKNQDEKNMVVILCGFKSTIKRVWKLTHEPGTGDANNFSYSSSHLFSPDPHFLNHSSWGGGTLCPGDGLNIVDSGEVNHFGGFFCPTAVLTGIMEVRKESGHDPV